MHPYLLEQLANDHNRELRRSASPRQRATPVKHSKPAQAARNRAGWILVELGLRLTSTAGEAPCSR